MIEELAKIVMNFVRLIIALLFALVLLMGVMLGWTFYLITR